MSLSDFPVCERGPRGVLSVIEDARNSRLGLDFEFDSRTNQPTIIGVATRTRMAAAHWSKDLAEAVVSSGAVLVAHAGIGADRVVLNQALGIKVPLTRWSDSMVRFWICNADLASTPKDRWGEDLTDGNAIGFMNLWSVASMCLDVPHWKGYRGPDGQAYCLYEEECLREGRPCPVHDEIAYCAADAWAGLIADDALIAEMAARGIPEGYYEWRARVTEAYVHMSDKGIWADLDKVAEIQARIDDRRQNIFPYRLDYSGKTRVPTDKQMAAWFLKAAAPPKYTKRGLVRFSKVPAIPQVKRGPNKKNPVKVYEGPFNPNSPKAVLEWMSAHGVELYDRRGKQSMGKEVLLKALKKRLAPLGLEFDPREGELVVPEDGFDAPVFEEPTEILLKLAQKTCASKGTSSWFNNKTKVPEEKLSEAYEAASLAIPSKFPNLWICRGRANSCGTSTSRIAMSADNYTNLPKRGALAECRNAIVAKPGFQVVSADYSQLEFRMCLWNAGENPSAADKGADGLDPFERIVAASEGELADLSSRMGGSERDVAKSLVHAADLGESLKLLNDADLNSDRWVRDRDAGALIVYDGTGGRPKWKYLGHTVTFTGSNIAERLFGSRTREARKQALDLISIYTDKFYPQIRDWQCRITREAEETGFASIPEVGHQVRLARRFGSLEDDLKFLFTTKAQGGGAVYATEGFMNFFDSGYVPSLFIHDETLWCEDIPISWCDDEIREFFRLMVQPSRFFDGFSCPIEIKAGASWGEKRKLGAVRWEGRTHGKGCI